MKVKSFEEACEARGYDPANCLPDVSKMPVNHQKALTAMAMMYIIAEAINDGHVFNWDDYNEYKYYPWFYLNSPGFRFGDAAFVCSGTSTTGGSRLCYKTEALAKYAGKQFLELYRDIMVIEK